MSGYGRDKLSYPWSYVTELVQPVTVESVVPDEPPDISEVCNSYTVHLTPEQALKFTSAMQAGFDLLYPDNWQDLFTLWDNARANVNNPFWEYSSGGCSTLNICALVAECIAGSDDVRDAIRELIEEANNGILDGEATPNEDDIDCVYGATSAIYELLLDDWLELKGLIDSAISAANVLASFLPSTLIDIPNGFWDGVETLVDAGTALYDAWINAQAQEDAFKCGIFDSVCSRGAPYRMAVEDIQAGFLALDDQTPPVIGILLGLSLGFNYNLAIAAWSRATDDICSNDWQTLCTCSPLFDDVTFDVGGYPDYTLQNNTVVGSGGNPDNCAIRDRSAGDSAVVADVLIDLGTDITVERVNFDFWYEITPNISDPFWSIEYLDSGMGQLALASDRPSSTSESTWHDSFADDVRTVSSVRYIRCRAGRSSTIITSGSARIDNIRISFT